MKFDFSAAILRFAEMYGLERPDTPQLYMGTRLNTRVRLEQFKKILLDELLEVDDIMGMLDTGGDGNTSLDVLAAIADWLGDVQVYCASEMRKFGLDNDEVLRIIMESNFSKLGADGKPIVVEGKVQKGPNYWRPEPMLKEYITKAGLPQPSVSFKHDTQVGGTHYDQGDKPQHWDLVAMYDWDYFQAQVFKYLMRWKTKHTTPEKRLEDLKKARSFLDKYILIEEAKVVSSKLPEGLPEKGIQVAVIDNATGQYLPQGSNDWWTNEGFYGDGSALFKCRSCGLTTRQHATPGQPHGCGLEGALEPSDAAG